MILSTLRRPFSILAFVLVGLTPIRAAFGQAMTPGSSDQNYALTYLLVILLVAVGLLAVLRPVGRGKDSKRKK